MVETAATAATVTDSKIYVLATGLAALLLLAPAAGKDLMDDVHQISAGDWKYVEIPLHQTPARITASYQVLSGSGRVRMLLMPREDLQWMNSGDPSGILTTPEGPRGYFTDPIRRLGDYVIVLDNREGRRYAAVRLHISLDYGTKGENDVGQLSARRQFTVIAISCVAFMGIVGFSARRLRKAMRLN
jgi:hypothetical protein